MTFINWDETIRFHPKELGPAKKGIPLPTYGNYGGPGYSAGEIGGTTPLLNELTADTQPKDALDALFYTHDLAYEQNPGSPTADLALIQGITALSDEQLADPEAQLYAGFATLALVGQLAVSGTLEQLDQSQLGGVLAATQEAVENLEAGLEAIPGEARSLHGAVHVFEAKFLKSFEAQYADFMF
jgi:hypothetical protein